MSLHRTHRRRLDRLEAKATKVRNRVFKDRERSRRADRMLATIRANEFPYTEPVMSWLSRQLEKPARKITPEDVKTLLA